MKKIVGPVSLKNMRMQAQKNTVYFQMSENKMTKTQQFQLLHDHLQPTGNMQ